MVQSSPPVGEITIVNLSSAGSDSAGSNVKVSAREFDISGKFFARDISFGKFIIGGHYQVTRYELDNLNADKNLHVLELPITLLRQKNEWTYITRLSPGLHSDFDELDSNDLLVTARFVATKKRSENLTWVIGAAVDRSFGDTMLYPVIGAQYWPSQRTLFKLVLPRLEIRHALSSKTILFWHLKPSGGKWNVTVKNMNKDFNVTTDAVRTSLGAEINLSDFGWLKVEAGREVNRSIELVDEAGFPPGVVNTVFGRTFGSSSLACAQDITVLIDYSS